MFFNDWYERLLFLITTFSVLIQAYVILLVVKVSPSSMKTYRYFLISYTIWDLLFTIVLGFVLDIDVKLPLMAGGYINGLAKYCGPHGGILALSFFTFLAGGLMYSMINGLVFRYAAVQTDPTFMQWLMKPMTYVWSFLMAILIAFIAGFSVYLALSKPETYDHDLPLPEFQAVIKDIANGQVIVNLNPFEWPTIRMAIVLIFGFMAAQVAAFLLGFATLRNLNRNARFFSQKTFRMHLQFTVVLCIQIATPVVFIVFPMTVGGINVLIVKSMDKLPAQIGLLLMSLYASSNSLLSIFFISPYRRYSMNLILKIVPCYIGTKENYLSSAQGTPKVLRSVSQCYVSKNRVNSVYSHVLI
uniref:Uncharacterized protein n=1 Tax=Ditylenchus dipsaci TaxID=166011 RepID=A0A915E8J4_9BILA